MTIVGRRGGSTRVGRPNNQNLFRRANQQLEAQAELQAERYNNALKVDAPAFYFWHKNNGSIPCSCIAANNGSTVDPGESNPTSTVRVGGADDDLDSTYTAEPGSLDALFGDFRKDPAYQKRMLNVNEKLSAGNTDNDEIDDSLLEDDDTDPNALVNFDDPLNLFNTKVIDCPICLGSGYIDSWQLHGGERFVFETSNVHNFYCEQVEINERENPTELIAEPGGHISWALTLPRVWEAVLKLGVYNGTTALMSDQYEWTITANGQTVPLTAASLEEFNNTGAHVMLSLNFPVAVELTHAEIVLAYREPFYAQIPEVTQGYEQEFLDWNVTLSVELPTDVQVEEGDYLTESKYARVWKLSTVTPRITAGGTRFGLSADLRALHQYEKKATQLGLFEGATKQRRNAATFSAAGPVRVEDPTWEKKDW